MKRILKSKLTWVISVLMLPLLLVACAGLMEFEGRYPGDDHTKRESVFVTSAHDYELSYLIAGDTDGQRVIFVHGTPGDSSGWLDYLRAVPEGREYIAIDRPGFGMTKPRKDVVSLNEQAAVLEPLLQTRDGRKPILVGHSLGGPIIAAAAANYPDKIGGIIIVAGALDPAQEDYVRRSGAIL